MAGGNTGLVLCQAGGQYSGQWPQALSWPSASNRPRYW
jgi:hypothetical protein